MTMNLIHKLMSFSYYKINLILALMWLMCFRI
jgi:hypothetical protein